jgi:hypothetical protein
LTEPLPVPLAPDVMVIHAALLAAVQLQPLRPLTVTTPFAAAGEVRFDHNGETVNAHGAPDCVIVNT